MLINQESIFESSHIEKCMYDYTTNTLKVRFKSGATYEYFNVSPEVYNNLAQAESQGKFFNENIKNNYDFNQLLLD